MVGDVKLLGSMVARVSSLGRLTEVTPSSQMESVVIFVTKHCFSLYVTYAGMFTSVFGKSPLIPMSTARGLALSGSSMMYSRWLIST